MAIVAIALLACAHARPPSATPSTSEAEAEPTVGASGGESGIRFIENDYARARAEARERGVPLFIDAWAPWCHTCLSMRSFVFPDVRLAPVARRFVWLSLDTEREENAALVTKLGVRVLPTLYVCDARDERVILAWPGSLTAPELATLLDETGDGGTTTGPFATDERVARVGRADQPIECLELAAREAPRLPPGTALADVVRSGIECGEKEPLGPADRRSFAELAALGERVASDPSQPILADDRSDLYDFVIGAYRALGRDADAKRLTVSWAAFLEQEARRAPNPSARAVFDAHRLLAYLALDEPARAVPMLEASERDFPGDYNPPARLATAYLAMKHFEEALAATRRALDRAYGPRQLRIWSLQADVLLAKGDRAGARASLEAALAVARRVPLTGQYPKQRDAIERRLNELR